MKRESSYERKWIQSNFMSRKREEKEKKGGKARPLIGTAAKPQPSVFIVSQPLVFPRPPRQLSQPNIRLLRDEKEKHIIAKYKLPATLHSVHRSPRIDNMYNRRPKKKIQK